MAYAVENFQSKKALVEAFKSGADVEVFQPGPFGGSGPLNGVQYLEGPHYPQPHRWYVAVEVENGVIVKIKK